MLERQEIVVENHNFSVEFDESNQNWSHQPEYNLMFVRAQQNYFNDKLRCRGVVFLNEIYEALGFDRTRDGQLVGWFYNGNKFIDFGVFSNPDPNGTQDPDHSPKFQDYITGAKDSLTLDFNVDGVVIHHLK